MDRTVQNSNAEIVLSCVEQKFHKSDITMEHHSLVRIVSGEMKVIQADSNFLFIADDTFLFPRNQPATIIKYAKDGYPFKSVVMSITADRLKSFYLKNPIEINQPHTHKIRTFDKHPFLESFFASVMPYFELSDKMPENLIRIKVEEALTILRTIDHGIDNLLADFSEPGKIHLADFMEQNYMFNIPVEKFGYLTGRSLTTFKRDFKKVFNTTPQKWLIQKRLELAHYQLSEKHKKPAEVYLEVGFENLSHFSFVFKKHFGYAPTALAAPKASL